MSYLLLIAALALASPTSEDAQKSMTGVYLCTTSAWAGISSTHREGDGPPWAHVNDGPPTRFKIRISPNRKGATKYRLVEIAYDGLDRNDAVWEDENSVLHNAYFGNGGVFHELKGPAFLTLDPSTRFANSDGDLEFYHSGFEYAGGEDEHLSVRWGRCRKVGSSSTKS